MSTYNLPNSLQELYNNSETTYYFHDYNDNMGMDNVGSMEYFLDYIGASSDTIVDGCGTQVVLEVHDRYFQIDSYGLGDFYSHGFKVSDVTEEWESI